MTDKSTAVIITAKNAAGTAAKAVGSALTQPEASEVLFVDDGSTDETSAAAAAADDGSGRLRIIQLDHNRGPSHGRNVAIDASSAPFLCILDADDFMAEDRLARLFNIGGEGWDLLADDLLFTDGPDEKKVIGRLLPSDFTPPRDVTLSEFAAGNLPRKDRYRRELGFLKPLIRRSFLDAHRIRYDERLRLGEDMLLYSQCLLAGARFRVVPACGYYSVQSPQSLSGQHRTEDIAALYTALQELELGEATRGRSFGRLAEYTQAVARNLSVREALDAKRKSGWRGFMNSVRRDHVNTGYVITELARAKLASFGKLAR
jgi:succinoglycan biosynthesis protein ExoU